MSILYLILNFFFLQNLLLVFGLGVGPALKSGAIYRLKPAQFAINSLFMLLAVVLAWSLYQLVVIMLGLAYLRTMIFVLVLLLILAGTRKIAGISADKPHHDFARLIFPVYFLCATMGLMVLCTEPGYGFLDAVVAAIGGILGYGVALSLCSLALHRMTLEWVPRSFRGLPLALISLGLVALVFMSVTALILPGMR